MDKNTKNTSHVSRNSSYLITGGCGFIGVNLISFLLKEVPGIKIRVLDNLSVGTREDLAEVCNFTEIDVSHLTSNVSPSSVELVIGDIRDYTTCLKACEGIDAVVHLAAQSSVPSSVENPFLDCETNINGTLTMLESSRKNKVDRFIFASSAAPLGEVEPPIHEEKVPRPISPYGASKLAGEAYCLVYYKTFDLKTVALRFGNVYGPRSKYKTSVVAKFFKQALEGLSLEIYGDGTQTRDFIYTEDLNKAIYLALTFPNNSSYVSRFMSYVSRITSHLSRFTSYVSRIISHVSPWGEVFQIATFKETTVSEIAEKIKELVESETERDVNIIHGEPRLGDIKRNYSDISKAKNVLGFKPEYNIDKGLKETFEFFLRDFSNLTSDI